MYAALLYRLWSWTAEKREGKLSPLAAAEDRVESTEGRSHRGKEKEARAWEKHTIWINPDDSEFDC